MAARRAPIDAYGVGTKMGVSAGAPYPDSAYKLVAYAGRPVMKLSPGKVTAPGAKQVHRGPGGDVLTLRGEPAPPGHQPLLIPVMRGGRRVTGPEPVAAAQQRCAAGLAWLPPAARALRAPTPVPVQVSPQLEKLREQMVHDLMPRAASDQAAQSHLSATVRIRRRSATAPSGWSARFLRSAAASHRPRTHPVRRHNAPPVTRTYAQCCGASTAAVKDIDTERLPHDASSFGRATARWRSRAGPVPRSVSLAGGVTKGSTPAWRARSCLRGRAIEMANVGQQVTSSVKDVMTTNVVAVRETAGTRTSLYRRVPSGLRTFSGR